MKKLIIILSIIIICLSFFKTKEIIIPEEAIRFRIIANSNSDKDQEKKKELVKLISKELINKDLKTREDVRNYLNNNLEKFTKIVETNYQDSFTINYGKNYFPKKTYKNITYPEGEYESLVIRLGEGEGKNFWCVLFPPLCLIDEETQEYPSLIKSVIDKYFSN